MFWLQTTFGNSFPQTCVFGSYRKLGQTKNFFYVDCKIRAHRCKMFSGFIFTSNNFRKPCLKRESLSTLLTQSKTHIQAHLSQAPASLDRATPRSKTHLQAYLQTISKKKKESNPRSQKEIRAGEIAHTTPHRITAPNPRSHR